MFELNVRGSGFLWHQIRLIVSLLVDIGERKEAPEVNEAVDI